MQETEEPPRQLVTVAEAAARVSTSKAYLYRMMREGRLTRYGIPGARVTRIDPHELTALFTPAN